MTGMLSIKLGGYGTIWMVVMWWWGEPERELCKRLKNNYLLDWNLQHINIVIDNSNQVVNSIFNRLLVEHCEYIDIMIHTELNSDLRLFFLFHLIFFSLLPSVNWIENFPAFRSDLQLRSDRIRHLQCKWKKLRSKMVVDDYSCRIEYDRMWHKWEMGRRYCNKLTKLSIQIQVFLFCFISIACSNVGYELWSFHESKKVLRKLITFVVPIWYLLLQLLFIFDHFRSLRMEASLDLTREQWVTRRPHIRFM